MGINHDVAAHVKQLSTPPPPGSPYAVPLPGTERENRTPIYRHWRFVDKPLLETLDPNVRTFYDTWQDSLTRFPNNRCLGARPWNPVTKAWENKFEWQTYAEVDKRSRNFGSGIVELHRRIGAPQGPQGVGLWCQNRPEWQITGEFAYPSSTVRCLVTDKSV
jgi:long-chain acyl-CoA synthetase